MIPLTLPEAAAWLLAGDAFCILTHRRPDGDTIGCAAALCRALRALGKNAWIYANPQFTPKYAAYLYGLTCPAAPEGAHFVAVDIATASLLPYGMEDARIELRLDHHGRDAEFGERGVVRPGAAACGELIADLLQELGVALDKPTAEALYLAISTDTGCFRFSNVTAATLRAAAACREAGADTFAINQVMFLTRRLPRLRLEARLTETTAFYAGGRIAISAIPDCWKQELGLTEDDLDDISGFGREIEGVELAAMLRQVPEGTKLSVRTSPAFDAAAVCAAFGGGGHRAAAGATFPGTMQEAAQAVLDVLARMGVCM